MEPPNDADVFLQQALTTIPVIIRNWLPHTIIENTLLMTIYKNFHLMSNNTIATNFRDHCMVPGTSPDDYKHRIITLRNGERVLTSIRFKGLNVKQPFVEVEHRSFRLESIEQVKALAQEVCEHYRIFEARSIRLFSWAGSILDRVHDPQIECDCRLLVAPLGVLRRHRLTDRNYDRIRLERAENLGFYPLYSQAYDDFHRDHPELVEAVPKEPENSMLIYVYESQVFNILIDGEWAGLVVADDYADSIWRGYMIADEILAKAYRGQGYAVPMQKHLVEQIHGHDSAFLLGTISPNNLPSMRTATHSGRVDVGGSFFISIDG